MGIYGAVIGFSYTFLINLYGIYLLLKARNIFKNERISDICELSVKLYGEWTRPWVSLLVVAITAMYLICFVIFFGTEIDQLLCQTFKVAQCGNNIKYTLYAQLLLLPGVFQKKLRNVGILSFIVLIFTSIAVGLIF